MAWERRNRSSASSNRGRGTAAMNSLEGTTSSLQPWACSSLSSSEKFLSLYEKMQEDREKKNLESLVCTPFIEQQGLLQEEQQHFPALLPPMLMMTDKPGSKIVFPHMTSRGSLVGNKVYCRTSVHTSITWRQKSSSQRMHTSLMILNYYQDRSSSCNRPLLGGKQQRLQSLPPAGPADSITSLQRPEHSLDKGQCRGLFLSLAGAAGMRLICPPVQLPLLEILLFFREQLSKNKAAPLAERGRAGLWHFPVNLAFATLRPFCGSLAGRCLTALLCLAQMRIKANNNCITTSEQHNLMRYLSVPEDLYSVARNSECNDLDRKEVTKTCSTNHLQIDDLVVTSTEEDDDVAVTEWTGQNNNGKNNPSIRLLSNVVVGSEFEEECWSDTGVQVVEILISEREDSLSDDTLPTSLAKDQGNTGSNSVSGCSADSEFSLVDLDGEDASFEPCLNLEESEKSSSENVLVLVSRNGLLVGVDEARKESFAQSIFAVSPPAPRLTLDAPSSMTVVKAPANWSGTVSALEDSECVVAENAMPLTDRMCLSEEEQPDSASLSQLTLHLKTSTKELAEDDKPCPASFGECDEAAVVVESRVCTPQTLAEETAEKKVGNELHAGKFVHFVERESPDRLVEREVVVCRIEEHGINETNCVSWEGLRMQVEVCPSERTSAEIEPEKESSNKLRRGHVKLDFVGDATDCILSEKLPEQVEVFLPQRTTDGNEIEKADLMVAVESLPSVLEEIAENQAVNEIQELKSVVCVVDEKSPGSMVDSPIEEDVIGGSVCVSPDGLPDMIELLMEANWTGARKEFAKATVSVPAGKPSPGLTGVADNQAVKNLQDEGTFSHSVGEKSAVKFLYQGLEVGAIENQEVEEIQGVKSEHRTEDKLAEEEHRIDCDDSDDWLESLLEQVEVFIAERADVLSEQEKASVSEVVENQAVKDIQEVDFTFSVEGISAQRVLDQECEVRPIEEYRIDDGNCTPSERLQGEVFLSHRSSSEMELDEKESPTASAVMVSVENLSLRLTESLEKEVVKEIQEVNTGHFAEEKPADGLHNQDLDFEFWPVEEHRIGDKDSELLEMLQGERDSFLSDRTSSNIDSVKGASPGAAVALSMEVPSSAVTELFEEQPIKEIQEVRCSHLVEQCEERVVNQEPEVYSIQGDGIQSEVNFSSNHSGVTSGESCQEHPQSICWTGESSSEKSTQTCGAWRNSSYAQCFDSHERIVLLCILLVPFFCSLTSRLNSATEAVDKVLDPDSGAIAVVLDDELNRDEKDGNRVTEAKVLDESKSGSTVADGDGLLSTAVSASYDNCNLNPSSAGAEEIGRNGENSFFPETCSKSSQLLDASSTKSCGIAQSFLEHAFADHPKCIELRERRHLHGDQTYIDMQDLLPAPWGQLIFWHGRCKEGRPTLCVLLGKAVRQLPGHELKNFIEVTVSHLEYAELNFFKGNVKQMNILMDLEGLGFMRLPPMHILSAIGAVLNRDYAGRGGWIILVNAPLMLGFVISAIQGVILRPSNNKGAAIDSSFKGFLEGKERIMMMGGKYRSSLQKHFDTRMLPVALGGDCSCGSNEKPCKLGNELLSLPWDTSSHGEGAP